MTEKERYLKRINTNPFEHRWVDFFFKTPKNGEKFPTEEELYAELNRMKDAKDLADKEVLGKRSI